MACLLFCDLQRFHVIADNFQLFLQFNDLAVALKQHHSITVTYCISTVSQEICQSINRANYTSCVARRTWTPWTDATSLRKEQSAANETVVKSLYEHILFVRHLLIIIYHRFNWTNAASSLLFEDIIGALEASTLTGKIQAATIASERWRFASYTNPYYNWAKIYIADFLQRGWFPAFYTTTNNPRQVFHIHCSAPPKLRPCRYM